MIILPRLPLKMKIGNLAGDGRISRRLRPPLRRRMMFRFLARWAGLRSTQGWAHASTRWRFRMLIHAPLLGAPHLLCSPLMAGRPCQLSFRHAMRVRLFPRLFAQEPRRPSLRRVLLLPLTRGHHPRSLARAQLCLRRSVARIRWWKVTKILLSGVVMALIGHGWRSPWNSPMGLR